MIILIIGAVMVVLSLIVLITYIRFVKRSVSTVATIVKVNRKNANSEITSQQSDGGTIAVEYNFNGKKYVNVLAESLIDLKDPNSIVEGKELKIYVDTKDPEKIEATNPKQMFIIATIALIAGLAFVAVGVLSQMGIIKLI